MAVTHQPIFAQGIRRAAVVATAAKTDYTANTNIVKICDANTNGTFVKSLKVIPRQTVTATACNIFVSADSGTTVTLIDSVLMAANTLSTTTAVPVTDFSLCSADTPIRLGPGDSLWGAITVAAANGIVFRASLEDL